MESAYFDEGKAKVIQRRINHFIKRVRRQMHLTQKEMADHLGYSLSGYRRFEKSPIPDNGLVSALGILNHFSSLDGIEAADLARYLDKGSTNTKEGQGNLRSWQKDLLKALDKVDPSVRAAWSDEVIGCRKDRLTQALEVMAELMVIGPDEFHAIKTLSRMAAERGQ